MENINPKDITIVDVDGDGACLYRCMVNFLVKNYNLFKIYLLNKNEYFDKFFDKIDISIVNSFLEGSKNELIETEMAKKIQQLIRSWVIANQDDALLPDLIRLSHELSIKEYIDLFTIFAGDSDYIIVEIDEVYKKGKNKGKKKTEKIYIQDRWGGFPELYIFSRMFDIDVSIYTLKKFCKSKKTHIPCTIRSKNALFCKLNSFDNNNIHIRLNLLLLLCPKNAAPHYQLLDYII